MRAFINGTTAAVAFLAFGLAGCATTQGDTNEPEVVIASGSEAPAAGGSSVVPAGTVIRAKLDQKLSVEHNERGDQFTATLTEPITYAGDVVVPNGAKVRGHITAVQDEDDVESDTDILKIDFDHLSVHGEEYPLDARLIEAAPEKERDVDGGDAAAGAVGGAAAGAILGAIIGEDETEGAIIGGAIGAATGTAIVLGTADEKAVLPQGSEIALRTTNQIALARR